jgi:hypothetical protein
MAQNSADTGFIHSVTSDTPICEITDELNERKRLRRKKCGTITSARLHQATTDAKPRRYWAVFITLTYADVDGWSPRHLSEALKRYRQWCKRRGFRARYVWTCELQKRGAPHYHLIAWLPYGTKTPKWDLIGWWPHGASNTQKARNAVGYIAKYVSKENLPVGVEFPRGLRICGAGGHTRADRIERRYWLFPRWVRDHFPQIADVVRLEGGGIVNRDTGEFAASPFRVVRIGGVMWILERKNNEHKDRSSGK